MSFFKSWTEMKERGHLLRRTNQLRLNSSQLSRLLGDKEVRAALQGVSVASLLPPVGTEVFRCLTPASLQETQQRHETEEKEQRRKKSKGATETDPPQPAPHLEAGRPLPFIYGELPPQLQCIPLEELDPFYQSQRTFVVVRKEQKENIIHRFNAESSCFLLSPFNPLRTTAIKILLHPLFQLFILLAILVNCVFISVQVGIRPVEYMFTAIYSSEALLKVVSRGFCVGRFTFLRDPWNWLDVLIIITACLAEFVDLGKFSVLMTIPRVLKIFAVVPGLKKSVEALVQSVRRLTEVIVLMVFCLSILAVICQQLFMGNLHHKCVAIAPALVDVNFTSGYYGNKTETGSGSFDFRQYINSPGNQYFLPDHSDALLCGNTSDAGVCPEGWVCLKAGRNPNYGYTSYDSFGWSLLAMFRLMMNDFRENLMRLTLRAAGKSYLSVFVLVFFPSCFFVLSLFVAVVAMALVEQEEAAAAAAKDNEEEFHRIVDLLKRREEEEEEEEGASSRVAPSAPWDSPQEKSQDPVPMEEGEDNHGRPCCTFTDLLLKKICCSCCQGLKPWLYSLVMNPFFDLMIIICLILNCIFMSLEHYPVTQKFHSLMIFGHLVFTGIFTAEMFLKLVALGPYDYFQVSWNVFDFLLVVLSLLELVLDIRGLSVLLRTLRLSRWWPTLHMLLKMVWTSVGSLTLVLVVLVFLFSVVGHHIFQKDFMDTNAADCELPRWHMNDLFHSFLVVFRVLCGEWVETMWDCMEVSGQGTCLMFYMVVVVLGNLLVLNVFLNLLLSSVSNDKLSALKRTNNLQTSLNQPWNLGRTLTLLGKRDQVDPSPRADIKKDSSKDYLALTLVTSDLVILDDNHDNHSSDPDTEAEIKFKVPESEEKKKHQSLEEEEEVGGGRGGGGQRGNTPEDCCCHRCYCCCPFQDIDMSQGPGRVWSMFRRSLLYIVQHRYFEAFIIFIIVLSCAALVYEDVHLEQRSVLQMVLDKADQVFTILFLVEMLLKWIALGFKRYFTSVWCWLDFLVLDASLVPVVLGMLGYSSLPLRSLRALRTLRALSRFQGLKVVLRSLRLTLPSLVDVLLVHLVVWMIFSVLGVNLLAGKFSYCFNDTSNKLIHSDLVNNKSSCFSLIEQNFTEIRWKTANFNFDNVLASYLTLLLMAASAGWKDIMYQAVDSRVVEDQPMYEASLYIFLYFIGFIIITFFIFNLFIRVFIDTLHQHRDEFGGKHVFMTEDQQKYWSAVKKRFSQEPKPIGSRPQNQCQACLFDLVTSPSYEIFMVVVICLNVLAMMFETDDQSMEKEEILYWILFIFAIIFLIEFFLKVIALRKLYFQSSLNVLDFVIIIIYSAGLFFADVIAKYFIHPNFFYTLRLARITRILHLVPFGRRIRTLLLGFMMSLPALFNIGLLLFLIAFTFSSMGMFHFAFVEKEKLIDDMFNFETFGNSMMSLIMVTTSSQWDGLLSPIMNQPPDCDPVMKDEGLNATGSCANRMAGIIYFSSYILLFFLLVVHLFIAVILETFNTREPDDSESLSNDHLEMFYKTWRKFDSNASQVIPYSRLSDFCDELKDPLRIPKPNSIKLIHMDLPLLPGDQVYCMDVLQGLTTQVFCKAGEMDILKARLEEKFMVKNASKVLYGQINSTLRRKQEEVAAVVIQRAYRKHLQQERTPVLPEYGDSVSGEASQ